MSKLSDWLAHQLLDESIDIPVEIGDTILMGRFKNKRVVVKTIDFNEIEDARWIGKSELLDIFAGLNQSIFPARKGSIANFLLEKWLSDRLQD